MTATIISTFATIGKTSFARKYPKLALDLESTLYRYTYPDYDIHTDDTERLKSTTNRIPNPEFPRNYIDDILANRDAYRFIFVTLSVEILHELDTRHIPYIIIYPDRALKDTLLARAQSRGNNTQFIERLDTLLADDSELAALKTQLQPAEVVILRTDEYLEDYIARRYGGLPS